MDTQELKKRLLKYQTQADNLELSRSNLFEIITDLARTKIVPLVAKRLPEEYQIDTRYISIFSTERQDRIPSKFELSLRLMYNNEPIFSTDERTSRLRRSLEPFLKELTEEYGLERIGVDVEPVMMG